MQILSSELEAPAISAAQPRFHALRVAEVVEETPDARSFVFDIPPELAASFAYRPGQFLTLRVPVGGRNVLRCYSMSSAPTLDTRPRVTVKRVAGGRASNWLCEKVAAGDVLEAIPPAGVFSPRSLQGDFVLFAGGSGITPVFSILRSALAQGQGKLLLVYANRDEKSVIFRERLRDLAAAHPGRLSVIHWLDSVQGVPAAAQLAELARAWGGAETFICGPGPFMDAAVAALEAIGMDDERIHVERFVSLPDEDDVPTAKVSAVPDGAAVAATLEVSLDGQSHTLACDPGETLLDAMLRSGVAAPFSCQAGMCASCMCQVQEGSVHLRHNEVLDARDLARAWTLSCQAVATSERVRVKFPE
ncbi:MAG TPA: ferredoxin--NADP reductase [Aromatoleum sp.]|uniref:ferredoxin--NADP reductase n=1 Tax=Aromatoleum sp. TaxID=2307007 RepID=UPI002B487A6F|nr:ferredoxin--NADP reductase [Aromatoleum sp.]HJV27632.1 ferredoxin--NADP reductase [Aromatoleum sp.]